MVRAMVKAMFERTLNVDGVAFTELIKMHNKTRKKKLRYLSATEQDQEFS